MGEAKRRRERAPESFEALDAEMKALGIDTSQFGFYDDPNFLRAEEADPDFLIKYARWVDLRPRDEAYDAHVRDVVGRLTPLIAGVMKSDKLQGGCVMASGMMSRMLDRLGVWSYATSGSLTLEVKEKGIWRGLADIDEKDSPNSMTGHAWVCAPPFRVIDATIGLQSWAGDDMEPYAPEIVMLEEKDAQTVVPDVTDMVSAKIRAKHARRAGGHQDPNLHHALRPDYQGYFDRFPASETHVGPLRLRYVPVAVRQTDVPLEQINEYGAKGRTGEQIWKEIAGELGVQV